MTCFGKVLKDICQNMFPDFEKNSSVCCFTFISERKKLRNSLIVAVLLDWVGLRGVPFEMHKNIEGLVKLIEQ